MITRYYTVLTLTALLCGFGRVCAEPLRVVSYNVENLFYPTHDSLKDDLEWTPEGERHWSYTRYYRKVENIARVLTNIGEWSGVDIVGLQEVENALCVKRLCYTLRRNEYDFVHYESPDPRGIDVALIYKKARIDTIRTRAIRVSGLADEGISGLEELETRDILYVCAKVKANGEGEAKGERVEAKGEGSEAKGDTIHLFVCHLPSQRGGSAETEWKREQAKRVLQSAVDSVLEENKDARIIVMGDMNSEPKEDIVGLKNRLMENGKLKMEN